MGAFIEGNNINIQYATHARFKKSFNSIQHCSLLYAWLGKVEILAVCKHAGKTNKTPFACSHTQTRTSSTSPSELVSGQRLWVYTAAPRCEMVNQSNSPSLLWTSMCFGFTLSSLHPPPPLLRPAQLDFYQNTHIVIKICSNENINSITLCSCRNVLADTLYTIKKPWQMRLSSSVFESVCFSVVQLLRHLNGFWEAKHFVQTICFREIYYHTGHCLKKPANAIANNNSPSPDDRRKKKCWHFTIKYPCVICIILTFLQYASCRAHNRGMSWLSCQQMEGAVVALQLSQMAAAVCRNETAGYF